MNFEMLAKRCAAAALLCSWRMTWRIETHRPSVGPDVIAEGLIAAIFNDLDTSQLIETLLLINGSDGTPPNELYVVYNSARRWLARLGIGGTRSLVGNYVTSLDMIGCSLTVRLLDREPKDLRDSRVRAGAHYW